jgi:N-formylglutamate amidohydrolase
MVATTLLCLTLLSLPKEYVLVTVIEGELPIVISAPHGGTLSIPDCPLRTKKETPQFATVLDTGTDLLAQAIATKLEARLKKKPWVVIANFSRKYVDANRKEAWGVESDAGKAVYSAYHKALRRAVDEVRRTNKTGLLIDVHGQSTDAQTVFRGTDNRKTVFQTLEHQGEPSFTGRDSFLGHLESLGVVISPTCQESDKLEHPKYDGGYIVQAYGSKKKGSIDAIQLEFGKSFRDKAGYESTAEKVAEALERHHKTYLVK